MSAPAFIDDYEIKEILGGGDFATTYRVGHSTGDYALKLCHSDSTSSRDRMRSEASALKELEHRSIPGFVKAGTFENRPFVVMELARGITLQSALQQRLDAGGVFGALEVVRLMESLLDALAHVHTEGLVHRDVKDANVVLDSSGTRLTLIDFGFAKAESERVLSTSDSFWRAGAARYSPPAKLENPSEPHKSHDVFAVGVVMYRLLTGTFPWDAGPRADRGDFAKVMRESRPLPATEHNSRVPDEVSRFVESLLERRDERRPTAHDALATARALSSAAETSARVPGRIRLPEVSRDPLYGDVRLTEDESNVLATKEMMRLSRIKQLGMTDLVFEGAKHSRRSHSIGCVFRVEQILTAIEQLSGVTIDRETRLTARLFALTHDVTHVSHGHTLEDELGYFDRHDRNESRVERLVLGQGSGLREALERCEAGQLVRQHFDASASVHRRSSIDEIVTGAVGADVLDYIDRDSYHCGLDHRVDSAIFRQLRLERTSADDEDHLVSLLAGSSGIRVDRKFAVEDLLLERYALFLKVYTHPRKLAGAAVLDKALATVLFPKRGKPELLEEKLEWFGDHEFLMRLESSRKAGVSEAARRILWNKMPRPVYRAQLLDRTQRTTGALEDRQRRLSELGALDPARRLELAAEMARRASVPAESIYPYCARKPPGHSRIRAWVAQRPGEAAELDSLDPDFDGISSRHLGLWEVWVFSGLEDHDANARLASEAQQRFFGLDNQISLDRRADALF